MVNDRQFILGSDEVQFLDWRKICLANGRTLCCQKQLKIWADDLHRVVLLGHAWQVDPMRSSPEEEIQKMMDLGRVSFEDVYNMEKTWCGRYLLIVNDWIYLDTIGSLGVFYSDEHVSSSLNVLCEVENRDVVFPDIVCGRSPDFVPGMRTCYDGVKRLLPSQVYNFVTHEVKLRQLLPDGVVPADSYEERIDLLEKYFIHSLRNMEAAFQGQSLYLALTGGRDSRVAMAMLEKSGVEYRTFTCWHEHIKKADVSIPVMLARKLKKEHLFVPRNENKFSQQRYDDYRIHTAGMAVDEDWRFYSYYQYDDVRSKDCETDPDVVFLRSSVWENANDYYSTYCKNGTLDFESFFPYIAKDEFIRESLIEWYYDLGNDPVNKEISIWNKILWDLRTGCWLSSIEQSFDMMEHITSIQPCNCRLFLSILMGFEQQDRVAKKHEEFIVQRVCPAIGRIPYDYHYKERIKVKTRIHRMVRTCCHRLKNKQK